MIETVSSRLFAIILSLLAHAALFAFLFLLDPLTGDGGRSRVRGQSEHVLVVELLPLDRTDSGAIANQPLATPALPSDAAPTQAPVPPPRDRTSSIPDPLSPGGSHSVPAATAARDPGQTAADLSGAAALQYRDILLAHIARYRQYPEDARLGRKEGTAWVRFLLDRDGRVLKMWLERGSGTTVLDTEAMAAVRRAAPLPAIPESLPAQIDITVPIEFRIE
jgi:protein TonB